MADKISRDQRSRVMASIHSFNTTPEMLVRSLLHQMGFRFRVHRKDLPGRPDICLPKFRKVIFVHGCFWHGHTCVHGSRRPASNREYWDDKLDRNICRDADAVRALRKQGWTTLIVWECQLKSPKIRERLKRFLQDTRMHPRP
jgi:DNA mismatch endonuclease (patch repair protein)